ncbi:MAG: hypothetical protein WC516_06490 [Patescibacteria group bacterium]|jgi:hypothetical protein
MGEDTKNTLKDIVDKDTLSKSFNTAMEQFKKGIVDDVGIELRKSKKEKEEEDDDDDDDDDDDADLFYEKKKMKKSLFDEMDEEEETAVSMDASPFLKSLAKKISGRFSALEKALNSTNMFLLSTGSLQKAMFDELSVIGEASLPTNSTLRKSKDRFEGAGEQPLSAVEKQIVMGKLQSLAKGGVITGRDVILAEGRLSKGIALEPTIVELIKSVK